MRLTCPGNSLSQENYHTVMSIALRLPCTGYGPLVSLSMTASPILGFSCTFFSLPIVLWLKLRPICVSLQMSLYANCLFISLLGVTSILTLQRSCLLINGFRIWPYCRLFIFTPLSQGKRLSCSLSPAQISSTHIRLNSLKHSIFTPWPLAKNLTFFHNIDCLLRCPLSDLTV